MKKILVVLLVVASLFAMVSCNYEDELAALAAKIDELQEINTGLGEQIEDIEDWYTEQLGQLVENTTPVPEKSVIYASYGYLYNISPESANTALGFIQCFETPITVKATVQKFGAEGKAENKTTKQDVIYSERIYPQINKEFAFDLNGLDTWTEGNHNISEKIEGVWVTVDLAEGCVIKGTKLYKLENNKFESLYGDDAIVDKQGWCFDATNAVGWYKVTFDVQKADKTTETLTAYFEVFDSTFKTKA